MKHIKKIGMSVLAIAVCLLLLPNQKISAVSDSEFASNESYYAKLCNSYTSSSANRKTCEEYQQYLVRKRDNANQNASAIQKEIDALGNNINAIAETSKKLSVQISEANATIATLESSISNIQVGIEQAEANILVKEENVKARKDMVKERMVQLQVKANTNQYVDYIMGATDLVNLIQRASSIDSFTKYDNDLMESLKKEIQALEDEKKEQERLKEVEVLQMENLENTKKEAESLYQYNLQLAATYEANQAALIEQKNEAIRQANIASGNLDQIVFEKEEDLPPPSTGGMMRPINGGSSAGTWAYPASFGGGLHLGVDKAVPIGTPVYAPANGVVLQALTATSSTGGGYIGNMIGFPYGGGNTLHILVNVDGQTYAISFFHMSPNIVSNNQQITQGQVIAYTGNTGNSSGPHCHIEIMKVNASYMDAINYWNKTNDWAWGCGWSTAGACSSIACRVRPESFGW